jgi:hypothetical protein
VSSRAASTFSGAWEEFQSLDCGRVKGENRSGLEKGTRTNGDEELLPSNTRVSNGGADGGLVLVDLGEVEVPTKEGVVRMAEGMTGRKRPSTRRVQAEQV